MQITFLKEWRNSDQMKYRYRIISKLITIKVLWELSYLNTLIKNKTLDFFHHHLLYTIFFHHYLYALSINWVIFCQSLIWGLK